MINNFKRIALVLTTTASIMSTSGQSVSAANHKVADYSSEPYVVQKVRTTARFENDGSGVHEWSARVQVQSEAGLQRFGLLVFGYNTENEKIEISYVRVRKPDGTVIATPGENIQDLASPVQRQAPMYTDYREKHVTVAGLRPGDILEYDVITRNIKPLVPGQFWFNYDFANEAIVLDEQLEINVPLDRAVKLKSDSIPADIKEGAGRRTYNWKTQRLETESEEHKKKDKKSVPPRELSTSDVQLTTFKSWEEVGRWYESLQRERATPTPEIRDKAAALTKDAHNDSEKLHALYDFVAKNFRYVSLSFGVGRYQPHSAADVMANQYGDCKDKHTLLESLLQASGFSAHPALINSFRKIDTDVPSPSQFNHVVTVVTQGKDLVWLDTTAEVAPYGLLVYSLRKKQALVAFSDRPPALVETPADPPFPNTQNFSLDGTVSPIGALDARVEFSAHGDAEVPIRQAFRSVPQGRLKDFTELFSAAIGLPGDVTEISNTDPAATNDAFQFKYHYIQRNLFGWADHKVDVSLPIPPMHLPNVAVDETNPAKPLELGAGGEFNFRAKIKFPEGATPKLPVPLSIHRDYGEYSASYKLEGTTVIAERHLKLASHQLPPSREADYQAFRRVVDEDEAQKITLEGLSGSASGIPRDASADDLNKAGRNALDSNNFKAALPLLERAVEVDPEHKWAWNNLGVTYLALREWSAAETAFRRQIEINPYDEYAYNNLGRTLRLQDKKEEATQAFRKQIEVNPLDKYAHSNLGLLLLDEKQYEKAIPELEVALSLTPANLQLQISLGNAYLKNGQSEKALAQFDKAVQASPTPPVWNNVSYSLAESGQQLERAQQYAESAIEALNNNLRNVELQKIELKELGWVNLLGASWDTLGWVHFKKGNLKLAEKYVYASWLLSQGSTVGDHLGQIYEREGRKQDAIHAYVLSLAALRPAADTRKRAAELLGGTGQLDALVDKARSELSEMRTIKMGRLATKKGDAEFFLSFSPASKVEETKFVSGNEELRSAGKTLQSASYQMAFPDDVSTRLIRRGILHCETSGSGCVFVLMTPDSVNSVD